jgi:hypothetical protein
MQAWVGRLLRGTPDEKARARTEIGLIFEARGQLEDAEETYWTNVQAHVADRRSYERLMTIYRQRGDRLSETLVERQLELAIGEAAAAAEPAANNDAAWNDAPADWAAPADARVQPLRRLRRRRAHQDQDDDRPTPRGVPARRTGAAPRQPARVEAAPAPAISMLGILTTSGAARSATALAPVRAAQEPVLPAMSMLGLPVMQGSTPMIGPAPQPAQLARARALQPIQPIVPEVLYDAPAELQGAMFHRAGRLADVQRRRVALSPHGQSSLRRGVQIATQPMTVGAFLLASIGAAAMIALLLFGFGRSSVANAAPNPAASLPARCVDANLRFPGANDPTTAVTAAYRQIGVDVTAIRPGGARLTPDSAGQVIGGWVGISLLLDRAGQPAPTLAEWLSQEPGKPTLANALVSGRSVDGLLTATEWAQVQALPANTCEGAFLRDPRNATLAHLVDGVISH